MHWFDSKDFLEFTEQKLYIIHHADRCYHIELFYVVLRKCEAVAVGVLIFYRKICAEKIN